MKISILGHGITAKAVRAKIAELGFLEVSVDEADLIVSSPGIPVEALPVGGAEVISEIEFAYRLFVQRGRRPFIIGVTGTNGKSTVTSMIAHLAKISFAGNIGVPLISFVGKEPEAIVVELSSFQLEKCVQFRPDVGIILNVAPDHLDRHHSMANYMDQKLKLFQAQGPSDVILFPKSDTHIAEKVDVFPSRKSAVSLPDPATQSWENTRLSGEHNRINIVFAIRAVALLGTPERQVRQRSRSFDGLTHRLEFVAKAKGRNFFNDSKATNPDATLTAVKAFDAPVHLILCGQEKGIDLTSFVQALQSQVASITVFGEIADIVAEISSKNNPDFRLFRVNSLNEALDKTVSNSGDESIILFSPGSSSMDQFKNFEDRGDQFKQQVMDSYV
ncbi:MAG: UDP-N-acetylmuramoylalanine--D-glutamate ligase [Candidatus Marinamargulisbacteria bacterium]|jgi:UDP-N-acetylmuramoylalanine--D-glutamate ligase